MEMYSSYEQKKHPWLGWLPHEFPRHHAAGKLCKNRFHFRAEKDNRVPFKRSYRLPAH